MERLTIPDVRIDEKTKKITVIDSNKVRENAMEIYWHLKEIEDILGDDYDLDRLRELVEADRDGRCVVLLRKPHYKLYSGYEIYIVEDGEVYMDFVQEVTLGESDHESDKVEAWYYTGNDFAFTEREWGKTVFPTSEAAEAALKGEAYGG